MFFAEATTTATSTNLFNIVSVVFTILGALTFIAAYFYVTFKKSERDYDKDTIRSLTDNNNALRAESKAWESKAKNLEGQLKSLQDMVTAAPQIAELAAATAKQHTQSMKLQKAIITELRKLVGGASK